jgi:tryptophan 7-halogenase
MQPVKTMVIVGGGISGWTVAAILAQGLRQQSISIRLIETGAGDSSGDAESSLPNVCALHEMLGLNDRQLMSVAQASFKLGTQYRYGLNNQFAFTHSLGQHGIKLPNTRFEQAFVRLKRGGHTAEYDEYFLAAVAAQKGKFAFPDADPKSVLSTLDYGLHLDSQAYTSYLKSYAQQLGVGVTNAEVDAVHLRISDSFIDTLSLSTGEIISADLWIDCSGLSATLMGDTGLKISYHDWSSFLPIDRAANFSSARDNAFLPVTQLTTTEWGWHKRIPLQNRTANQFLFCTDYLNDVQAAAEMHKTDSIETDLRFTKISPGCRAVLWQHNCIAMGASACSITPLAISELQLVQSATVRLLDYFPDKNCLPYKAAEYNRLCLLEIERSRNFHMAHYYFMHNTQSAFAKRCQQITLPDELQDRIDLFRSRGRITVSEYELVEEDSWVALFLGLKLWPERYDPFVDLMTEASLLELLNNIKNAIGRKIVQLPSHEEFIAHYCPSR